MTKNYYTIGIAGHIDHGKTTLTKALTNIETDRLKEEKERNISIELGYAPIDLGENIVASIVDVPGHEKFIRQMIAGVAGIDIVILVIAADEGVMPQTREHLEILTFLGITKGIVAVTKVDKIDDEMKEIIILDIHDELLGTPFEKAEMIFVDSLAKIGIEELREKLLELLPDIPIRNISAPFRMPIDQVFTIQGKGTIVRGTVFEGTFENGEEAYIKPSDQKVKVRSIEVHNAPLQKVYAGQRAAMNITGISIDDVKRGDVLSTSPLLKSTKRIDIVFKKAKNFTSTLKQRETIKVNMGTNETMGKIIFFDRNELTELPSDVVVCQLLLEQPVSVLRDDKIIIRKPSPSDTIGGGWVIDPFGEKYRFGQETVDRLTQKMKGTPRERVIHALQEKIELSTVELLEMTTIQKDELLALLQQLEKENTLKKINNKYVLNETFLTIGQQLIATLNAFHKSNSLKIGMNKAELLQSYRSNFSTSFLETLLHYTYEKKLLKKVGQYIASYEFNPYYPEKWEKRMETVLNELRRDGLKVKKFDEYIADQAIPDDYRNDLITYYLHLKSIIQLDNKHFIHYDVFIKSLTTLYEHLAATDSFTLQDAREILTISRKYLVMFLDMLDERKITKRSGVEREWIKDELSKYL